MPLLFFCDPAEDVVTEITLAQILNFFTSADYPPPLGFDQCAALYFSPVAEFPCASTRHAQGEDDICFADEE